MQIIKNYVNNSYLIRFDRKAYVVRKIGDGVPLDVLQEDLENLRQKALELGATEAKIITTDMIVVDERVRAKCMNPKCPSYGTNGNCPPYAPDLDMVRKIIGKYKYAIFVFTKFQSEPPTRKENHPLEIAGGTKSHEIIAKIEAEAFHNGYYLAMGLGAGPCKPLFCPDLECSFLKGEGCRQGLKARYSMESWGMDAFLMATRAGWDVYPGGSSGIPYLVTLGLVLIF